MLLVEEPGTGQRAVQQIVTHALAQRSAEPTLDRNRKPHLWAIEHLARQVRLHRFLEDILALVAIHFQRGGKACAPFHEGVIHQRLTHLQRVGHAGPIDFCVDIAVQVGLDVQILNERERIVRGGATCMALEHFVHTIAAQLRAQLR